MWQRLKKLLLTPLPGSAPRVTFPYGFCCVAKSLTVLFPSNKTTWVCPTPKCKMVWQGELSGSGLVFWVHVCNDGSKPHCSVTDCKQCHSPMSYVDSSDCGSCRAPGCKNWYNDR